MNKYLYFTLSITLILLTIVFLFNPALVISSVLDSVYLFFKNVFPSLFLFFILTDFLIAYNILYKISSFLSKFLKIDANIITISILSLFCGYPSNAKFIDSFLNLKLFEEEDASILLGRTFFPGPMFVLGTVGISLFNSYKFGIIILFSIYITNIILLSNLKIKSKGSYIIKKDRKFGLLLRNAITNSMNSLIIILGSISLFYTLTNIINYYLDLNEYIHSFICSILEITNGVKKISTLDLSTNLKIIFSASTLTFGGLSVHSQMLSILGNYNITYKIVIKERLKAVLINFIIICILLYLS